MLFFMGIVIFSRLEETIAKDKMESTSFFKKTPHKFDMVFKCGIRKNILTAVCHCNSYLRIKQTKVDGNKHFN